MEGYASGRAAGSSFGGYLSDDGSTPSMTGDTARDSESYIA